MTNGYTEQDRQRIITNIVHKMNYAFIPTDDLAKIHDEMLRKGCILTENPPQRTAKATS